MRGTTTLDHGALLAAIVDSTDDAIVSKNLEGVVTTWNKGAERIFGWTADEMVGSSIFRLIPPGRQSEEKHIIATICEGRRVETYDTMRLNKSGVIVPVSITVSPIFDAAGNIIGASKIARSISDRLKSEETRRVLMREVAHRSKNMLAIVEAIVRQTAKRSPPADFAERLSMRLRSIAASQDLLVSSEWSGVEIGALVDNQLSHRLVGSSILAGGPALVLKPAAAQTLGMALHELLTNAQQFGSLSIAGGHVDLSWALIEEGALFEMKWVEVGGPAIAEKPTAGFGQTVLRRITEGSLDGKVQHVYAPSGVQWTVRAPTDMVLA